MSRVARRVRVFGRVQGVFFRAFTRDVALAAGVAGFVRNLPDGSVEAVIEGEERAVLEVIEWMRRGPPAARVDAVEVDEEAPTGREGPFTVER